MKTEINKKEKEKLVDLYNTNSKHSNYQIMPDFLSFLSDNKEASNIKRFEKERMSFLLENLDFLDRNVLDVGGNTGFFALESVNSGAKKVFFIEGNRNHSDFVRNVSQIFNKDVVVFNQYLDFKSELPFSEKIDITLLFNVIHHLGDDFGDKNISLSEAKKEMSLAINYFANKTNYLVLQMGFCWKGDGNLLIFEEGTKKEMIDFIKRSVCNNWDIICIGVAEENEFGVTKYNYLNDFNIERNDSLREFRNRPIFILKSKI